MVVAKCACPKGLASRCGHTHLVHCFIKNKCLAKNQTLIFSWIWEICERNGPENRKAGGIQKSCFLSAHKKFYFKKHFGEIVTVQTGRFCNRLSHEICRPSELLQKNSQKWRRFADDIPWSLSKQNRRLHQYPGAQPWAG